MWANNVKYPGIDQQSGYTVVELMIVLAIIGLFSVVIIASGGQNIKVERFSGSLRNFADSFREAQVASYSIKSGECPSNTECFWRGALFEFTASSSSYTRYRLSGTDVSQFVINSDQRKGIKSKTSAQNFDLRDSDLHVRDIGIGCDTQQFDSNPNLNADCNYTTNRLSVAFLAPDGRAYIADDHYSNSQLSSGNPERPYSDDTPVTLLIDSLGTDLIGYVTFNPKNANVDVQVKG